MRTIIFSFYLRFYGFFLSFSISAQFHGFSCYLNAAEVKSDCFTNVIIVALVNEGGLS